MAMIEMEIKVIFPFLCSFPESSTDEQNHKFFLSVECSYLTMQ